MILIRRLFGKLKEMRQWLPLQIWELRGKIFYKEHYKTRVVSHVEWLDSKQRLRSVDYYTKEGFKFAETVYDLLGNAILKSI